MRFADLLAIVGDEPLFETGLLLAGDVNANNVRRQLSRWTGASKLFQLRRGLYALAPPYQKTKPHPFLVANRLVRASYVSLQAAMAYYGLIPEHVPAVTSVTTARPGGHDTPLGRYLFRHVKRSMFRGHLRREVQSGQAAFVAAPEKALLDLIYLQPGGDDPAYLRGLRLQNLDRLDLAELQRVAGASSSAKLARAVATIEYLAAEEAEDYEALPDRPG